MVLVVEEEEHLPFLLCHSAQPKWSWGGHCLVHYTTGFPLTSGHWEKKSHSLALVKHCGVFQEFHMCYVNPGRKVCQYYYLYVIWWSAKFERLKQVQQRTDVLRSINDYNSNKTYVFTDRILLSGLQGKNNNRILFPINPSYQTLSLSNSSYPIGPIQIFILHLIVLSSSFLAAILLQFHSFPSLSVEPSLSYFL